MSQLVLLARCVLGKTDGHEHAEEGFERESGFGFGWGDDAFLATGV